MTLSLSIFDVIIVFVNFDFWWHSYEKKSELFIIIMTFYHNFDYLFHHFDFDRQFWPLSHNYDWVCNKYDLIITLIMRRKWLSIGESNHTPLQAKCFEV